MTTDHICALSNWPEETVLKVAKKATGLRHYDVVHTFIIGRLSYRCLQVILVLLPAIISIYFWSANITKNWNYVFAKVKLRKKLIHWLFNLLQKCQYHLFQFIFLPLLAQRCFLHHQLGIIHKQKWVKMMMIYVFLGNLEQRFELQTHRGGRNHPLLSKIWSTSARGMKRDMHIA